MKLNMRYCRECKSVSVIQTTESLKAYRHIGRHINPNKTYKDPITVFIYECINCGNRWNNTDYHEVDASAYTDFGEIKHV